MKTFKGALPKTLAVLSTLSMAMVLSSCSALLGEETTDGALNKLDSGFEECDVARVYASSEKAQLLSVLADKFNDTKVEDGCSRVLIYSQASGSMMNDLAAGWDEEINGPRPDVWTPASTSWLRLLSQKSSELDTPSPAPLDAPSIANTPLVIAMPRPMAEALGWPDTQIGWGDVLSLSQNPQGWGSVGHPEWGAFKLGKTNPNFSTSGLNATVGSYYAATGLSSDLAVDDVTSPEVLNYISGIESSVVHYGDTTLTFLSAMDEAAKAGRGLTYVSAVTLEEKSVWDYNQGNPTGNPELAGKGDKPEIPLVAVYPKEGTLISDNPYAILNETSVPSKASAEKFLTFLQSKDSQDNFKEAGFRDYESNTGELISESNGLLPAAPATISPPNPQVLSTILDSWKDVRKGARVMLVVDVSGSMEGDKLSLAKEALLSSLDQFASHDQVGLAVFSDNYQVEVAVGEFTAAKKAELRSVISSMRANGGTRLYASTLDAVKSMESLKGEGTIDAVVVLSDGEDTAPGDLGDIVDHYESLENPEVRLFSVAYGSGADADALEDMSKAGLGAVYDASDPASIDKVMTAVISNF